MRPASLRGFVLFVISLTASACSSSHAPVATTHPEIRALCAATKLPTSTALEASALRAQVGQLFQRLPGGMFTKQDLAVMHAAEEVGLSGPPAAPTDAPAPLATLFAGGSDAVRSTSKAKAKLAEACATIR